MSSPLPACQRQQQHVDADRNRAFPFAQQPPLSFSPSGFHFGPSVATASDRNSSHQQDASQTTANVGSSPIATRTGTTPAQTAFGQSSEQVGGQRPQPTSSLFGHRSPPVSVSAADFFQSPPAATSRQTAAAGPESGIFSPVSSSGNNVIYSSFGQPPSSPPGLFGQSAQSNGGSFGLSTQSDGGTFGQSTRSGSTSGGLQSTQSDGGLFGSSTQSDGGTFGQSTRSGSTFGGSAQSNGGLFGSPTQSNGGLFGSSTQSDRSPPSFSFGFGRPSTSGTSSGGGDGLAIGGLNFNSRGAAATASGGSTAALARSGLVSSRGGTDVAARSTTSPSAMRSPMLFADNRPVHEGAARNEDAPPTPAIGTRHVAFQITNVANGLHSENIFSHSITAMPQYSNKSFEELRLEDYMAGNRGSLGQDRQDETREAETEDDLDSMERRLKDVIDDLRRVKNEHGRSDDGMNCLLCLSQRKCVALLPCRHLCLCEECSKHPSMNSCPLCRNSISDKLVVFM